MDTEKTEKIKKDFITFLKATPASIPYLGAVFTRFVSEKGSEEIKLLLEDIKNSTEKQLNELIEANQIEHDKFTKVVSMLEIYLNEQGRTSDITVIIPTGGKGESMFPITSMIPKSLVPIGGKPMLLHIIDTFLPYRNILFNSVIVITRGDSPAIEYTLNQSRYEGFVHCRRIEKNVPGALLELGHIIQNKPFLLHYNDILIKGIDWKDVLANYTFLRTQRAIIGLVVCSKYYPLGIGVIEERQNLLVKNFKEKPNFLVDSYANTGVSIFEPDFLNYINKRDKGIFEDSVKRVIKDKKEIGMYKIDKWYHVHDLKDYRFIQKEYKYS